MMPKPHEQFRAFQREPYREARNPPFICEHVSEKGVFATDACGNPRVFLEKVWAFKEAKKQGE